MRRPGCYARGRGRAHWKEGALHRPYFAVDEKERSFLARSPERAKEEKSHFDLAKIGPRGAYPGAAPGRRPCTAEARARRRTTLALPKPAQVHSGQAQWPQLGGNGRVFDELTIAANSSSTHVSSPRPSQFLPAVAVDRLPIPTARWYISRRVAYTPGLPAADHQCTSRWRLRCGAKLEELARHTRQLGRCVSCPLLGPRA